MQITIRYRKRTVFLINLLLFQGLIITFNMLVEKTGSAYYLPIRYISEVTMVASVVAVIVSVMLLSEIIRLAEKENEAELNALRLQESQHLVDVLRSSRHDFLNHIQVIYGLAQIGQVESLNQYINELTCGMEAETRISRLAHPELAALLIKKSSLAAEKGIYFNIDITTDLGNTGMNPVELVRVVGNLVDNALYAVEESKTADPRVKVAINEDPHRYIISISNTGHPIPDEIRDKIFAKGFSTKGSEGSGLGLHIIKKLVDKNRGSVELTSSPDYPTVFTVGLPKLCAEEKIEKSGT